MSYDTIPTVSNGQPGPPDRADEVRSAATDTAQVAADQGHAVVDSAAEQARELTREARDQLATVTGEARDQAQRALSSTTDELANQLEERLGDATSLARTRADELRALAEGRPEDAGSTRDLALKASQRIESMADRVDDLGVRGVVEEVAEFGRRRPLLFLAGAAGAGLLVGRLARAAKDAGGSPSSSPAMATAPTTPLGTPRPLGDTAPAPIAVTAPLGVDPTSTDGVVPGPVGSQAPGTAPTPPPPPPPAPLPPQGPMGTGPATGRP